MRRAQKSYEAGEFSCLAGLSATRTRVNGAGPHTKHLVVGEALYNHFLHFHMELRGRVTSSLLRAKAIALFSAYKGDAGAAELPPNWRGPWLSLWLANWRNKHELSFRTKNKTYSLSYAENRKRLGMLWRNCNRASAFYYPNELQWDAFDHTPTTRRLATGKQIAPTGSEKVGAIEDNAGEHDRHTTVLFSSSDGMYFKPHDRC